MIYGVGVDVVQVSRIEEAFGKYGERFQQRIFTAGEIEYCESFAKDKYHHYAARFAAKEAAFKAFRESWKRGFTWKDFEVVNDDKGAPSLVLNGVAGDVQQELGINSIHLSLSHTKISASAVVVAEK